MAEVCGGSNSVEEVSNYLQRYVEKDDWESYQVVIIENNSPDHLEYNNQGCCTGDPVVPVGDMFKRNGDIVSIPPNHTGGIIYRLNKGSAFGKIIGNIASFGIAHTKSQANVTGYISVKARCPGKNHVIALGFSQGRNRVNKCGIQIRGEDGVLDDRGNITGHGTDATGVVSDIALLANSVCWASTFKKNGKEWHEFKEESRALKVRCQFNNEWKAKAIFTFTAGSGR